MSPRCSHACFALALLSLSACGGAQRGGERTARPIDRLRAEADDHPDDPRLRIALAIGENLADGGEPARARTALERAKQLADSDLRLGFLEAEQSVLEGAPARALTAYLTLIERAQGSHDPLAPMLAEAAILSVLDMNDATADYRPRVRAALAKLRPETLGLRAAHHVQMARLTDAFQQGDVAAAERARREAGCLERAEAAGPFGPRELLGFDQKLAAEAPGALAKEHDLGPGRGVRPVRALETRRCAFGLGRGAHDPLPGTTVLRSELTSQGGAHALRVESPNSYVVWVDGQEIARIDLRGRHPTGVVYLPLTLSAGTHELKVKVSSRHPNPVLSLALVRAEAAAIEASKLPAPKDDLERYVVAKLSLSHGDVVGARELTRKLGHQDPTAPWLVLEAASAMTDPLRTAQQRRDRARELLERARKQNDRAWYPSVGIARLASAEGRAKEAIDALRESLAKWPEAMAVRTSLIEQLRESGYVEEADRLIGELQKTMPDACAAIGYALTSARSRGRMSEVVQLTERAMKCDATSNVRLSLLRAQRKYDDAAQEIERLRTLGEPLDAAQTLETELERARLLGDQSRERKLRAERSAMWPDRTEPVLDQVDLQLARGERRAALSSLASALEANPSDLYELRRVQEALSPDELFKGHRKRTSDVIRSFEAAKTPYAEPQVLVLDYTVVRVFEDGSSVSLTHNVMRVQSQEAVDQNGEFAVPEGARLLSLHTLKADGTRLEPDAISGKSTWSLPNLAPGDYVEFEYVRGEQPSAGFPGGYLGERFYFKSFEVPFHQSELVVVLPAGMEPVLDPRGPLPKLVKESKDGLTVLRWTAQASQALSPEPSSVASREFLPSINLGVKVSWAAYVESVRDLLTDKDVYDPAAEEFVRSLLGAAANGPASTRAAILHRWVTEQIEATDDVFGPAAAMLSARTGSRERVLKYMLALAGVESELVLVRGAEADHSEAKLPDPETYGHLLLRVATERGPLLVDAGQRHAPFGFLPALVRGEKGLVINAQNEVIDTPPTDLEGEVRNVDVSMAIDASGSAKVHVREQHQGASAVEWRNDLDSIPAAELKERFEQSYASNVIPGARLTSLEIGGREDAEATLVLDYEVEVSELGQRTGSQLRMGSVFPALLSARYARQGARTTTEVIAPPQASDVRTRVTLPKGARVVALPKAGALTSTTGASFHAEAQPREDGVDLTRTLRLPLARVTPDAYPAFATFCRSGDALESSELVIELPE